MKLARTKNTVRNMAWGMIYRLVTLLGPFAVKTILIRKLGLEYSGLSSLFTSILTVLNLANLGFSSSLVYTMYQAAVDDDKERLCALLNFYRRVYRMVGFVILGLGLAIMPFLPHLVQGDVPTDVNLYTLFLIYLAEAALGYLMFAYVIAIFDAYQRSDVTMKVMTIRFVVQYGLQILSLFLFANYYVYIAIFSLMVIPNNIMNYLAARKLYPDITCKGELDDATKKSIYHRVFTLFGHKVGNTVLVSIDSVIISAFLGLRILSLYSNYYYILTAVNALVEIVTNASIAGIGNKLITDTKEDNYRFFKVMTYGWIALVGAAATCMLCFYQPFIAGVWLGEEYLLNNRLMALIVLYFYAWMFRIMQLTYRDAAGLWDKDWLKPYVALVLNLTGSIWMVKSTGSVAGVLVPTIAIMLFVYFPWEARVLFRHLFHRSWKEYFVRVLSYTALALLGALISYGISMALVPQNTFLSLLVRALTVVVVYPGIWWVFTHRSPEYASLMNIFKSTFGKRFS